MEPPSFWQLSAKSQFALLFVSSFAAKLLHLYSHRSSLPILLIVLYTPTFLLPDILLILFGKLVYRQNRGKVWKAFGALLALVTVTASASQISFYMTTGGEVQWMAAGNLAKDPGGLRMLLSELPKFFIVILAFAIISWLIAPRFDTIVSHICQQISLSFKQVYQYLKGRSALGGHQQLHANLEKTKHSRNAIPSLRKSLTICAAVSTVVIDVLTLQIVRPRNPPYAHMSGSLPITLFESAFFSPINSDFCLPFPTRRVNFPLEEYVKVLGYSPPLDWKPFTEQCHHARKNIEGRPDGPPSALRNGELDPSMQTHSPAVEDTSSYLGGYDASCDPLKLSNLNEDILDRIMDTVKNGKPLIKHVLFVTLESTRKDMFPFKKDSSVYQSILSSYGSTQVEATKELNGKLSNLTRTAAFLTGESTNFSPDEAINGSRYLGPWAEQFRADKGGINVQHAVTGSAFTLKSLITSHCGVDPLPVDFTEEIRGQMYQPCFPHISELFNKAKKDDSTDLRVSSGLWDAALVQSITDQWDSQYTLDEQMGFHPENIILDTTIEDPTATHFPPKQPRCNYFGYPETESLPYLRDMFIAAKKNNRRLWASHITSTTHHPYTVPESWPGKQSYVASRRFAGLENEEFDRYLNTIKYQDEYLDTLFTTLHDIRVLHETLVVLVGDHGLALTTPDGSKSTFENGHPSNLAIPLTFIHPDLPRIQLDAQTTPTSILPTVLDILLQTDSLAPAERRVAHDLLPRYQGQSLIRARRWSVPTTADDGGAGGDAAYANVTGPQPFHFSVINPGGSLLAVSQAGAPFRLLLPLCSTLPLTFGAAPSPREVVAWSADGLADGVREAHGDAAARWADLARRLGEWWVWETRDRWGYHRPARSTDRGAAAGVGSIRKKHWWET